MRDQSFCVLNIKKLCLIYKRTENDSNVENGFGFFSPEMENEEVKKFLIENSDDLKHHWFRDQIMLNFKIVNAPDNWMYLPETEEEWNEFKKEITIH